MGIFIWEWIDVSEIYIWDWNNYSAMQWPCSSGYHVPTSNEWESLIDIWTSLWWLSTDTTNFCISLKLPLAGRCNNSATIARQGEQCRYRCSEITSGSIHSSDILNLTSSGVSMSWTYRSWWCPIRPFKDSSVLPNSSWIKLYWTSIESWWIFWSSTDWLISLSSNWQTWITIADKNLWATNVWNSGDTLSVSNCGNYFQRWNNYWFPFTWTIGSTSWSLVNADLNWPWNYYSSSTFITRSGSPYRWDSGDNADLWGWTTGMTTWQNVKEVYVWSTKVRPTVPADMLCFTAEEANSTIQLNKQWSPTAVELEISRDWNTWSDYSVNTNITFTNVGDKVYIRNKSETPTAFSTWTSAYYRFLTSSGHFKVSWDVNYLLCKNSTDTLTSNYCFYELFYNTAITSTPKLSATTLTANCYGYMFTNSSYITTIPELPAIELKNYCYRGMFQSCTWIKLSSTQTWDYTQAYRIPTTWTWTTATWWNNNMFSGTWWTFTSAPTINTTYYTSNTVV